MNRQAWPLECYASCGLAVIEKTVLRLMIGLVVPLATALVVEQLPKSGIAEVPFAFQVKDRVFPAGTYAVKQADLGLGVKIENEKVPGTGMKLTAIKRKFGPAQEPRLVFAQDGGHRSLSEIWLDAEGRGLVLEECPPEQEVQSVNLR